MFSTKRWELRLRDSDSTQDTQLKKKSQSIDISGSGYEPLAPAAQHAIQPTKPAPVIKTTTFEEEQNNTANTQRRNPRRGELKRYYTIGQVEETAE